MNRLFVACELGEDLGRVMLGTLRKDQLTLSEVHRFESAPLREKEGVLWDIGRLYQEMLSGFYEVGGFNEPVDSVSCTAGAADYLLFDADGSLIAPTHHHSDPRAGAGRKEVLSLARWETIYGETGVHDNLRNTLFQLGAEKARRLKRADLLMPVADGFNFLLSGAPFVETSSACATQIFNPLTKNWSEQLIAALGLPPKLLPLVVPAGTKLKTLRPEIVEATRLEDAHVVASCSNELAAALAALPVEEGEPWAFLHLGRNAVIGTSLFGPLINQASREANLSHTLGHNGAVYCHAEMPGLAVLDECRRLWAEVDQALDDGPLAHLAATAEPLVSLVNLADPRFAAPGNLLEKAQSFCKETGQIVPRKPGPIFRCLMESLALVYRRALDEISRVTGREFTRVYLLGDATNSMLHHFIANALQMPVVVAPANAAVIGNVIVQALAMGRIQSLPEARRIVQQSFKFGLVQPHPAALWAPVYERFLQLSGARAEAVPA